MFEMDEQTTTFHTPPHAEGTSPDDERDLAIARLVAAFGGGELTSTHASDHRPLTAA